jgi:hypothetical protein
MELTKQNLELVKKLLEDKINYYKPIVNRLENLPDFLENSDNKQALIKQSTGLEECLNLLYQVLKELELKKNCEGTFITGFHD